MNYQVLHLRQKKNLKPDEFGTLNSSINDILDDMSKNGDILAGNNLRDSLRKLRDDFLIFPKV